MGLENWEEPCTVAEKVKMGQEKVNKGKKRGDQGEGEAIQPFEHICGGKKSDIIRAQYFQQQ